ncbi:MAG: acyltransferase family protein [Polyangiaceae bacterium]|jgi:peptidoglycan/LPS O-acetylase OafA/YrhL
MPSAPKSSGPRTGANPLYIPSLDGLRAISFFIVFSAHAGLDRIVPGGFGVTVFFFLSGYLITTLMRAELEGSGRVSRKHFYLRRALRILPPFYIVLTTATVLGAIGFLGSDDKLRPMPVSSQFLHFSNYWIAGHGWGGVATGTGVFWSLAVEEHFYLLFPTVYLTLSQRGFSGRQKAIWFWSACGAVLAWRCVLVLLFHSNVDRTYLCSDTRVDSIAFGCALAVWNNPSLDRSRDRTNPALWQRFLIPAATGLLLVTFIVRAPAFRETIRYTLQGVALTPIFMAAVRWPQWAVFRILNWQPIRFVGTLSYSLYLVHQVVLAAVQRHAHLGVIAQAPTALLISFAVSWAMYIIVEKPCARLRRRLSAAE